MDFRPRGRIKDPKLLETLKFELDECEVTGETRNLHLHHVYFKSHGGDDMRSNIVCLEGRFHERYHRGDAEAVNEFGRYVAACRPDVMRYLQDKLGSASALSNWLERHGLRRHENE